MDQAIPKEMWVRWDGLQTHNPTTQQVQPVQSVSTANDINLTQVQPLIYFQDSISWHLPKSYKEHLVTVHVLCGAVNHAQC